MPIMPVNVMINESVKASGNRVRTDVILAYEYSILQIEFATPVLLYYISVAACTHGHFCRRKKRSIRLLNSRRRASGVVGQGVSPTICLCVAPYTNVTFHGSALTS